MDTVAKYREIVQRLMMEYVNAKNGKFVTYPVFDGEHDRYLVVSHGWDDRRRHYCVLHVDIIDGKIWVQCDNTDRPIALELVAAGVPRDHIVLGFRRPELRKHTEFAVA